MAHLIKEVLNQQPLIKLPLLASAQAMSKGVIGCSPLLFASCKGLGVKDATVSFRRMLCIICYIPTQHELLVLLLPPPVQGTDLFMVMHSPRIFFSGKLKVLLLLGWCHAALTNVFS